MVQGREPMQRLIGLDGSSMPARMNSTLPATGSNTMTPGKTMRSFSSAMDPSNSARPSAAMGNAQRLRLRGGGSTASKAPAANSQARAGIR